MLLATHRNWLRLISLFCAMLLVPGDGLLMAQQGAVSAPQPDAQPMPGDQLDSLVAPIALYPDPLLAQVLAASTYPLELVQLQQWLAKHKDLKDKALADAVQKQDWDPSVQAMAGLPDVVKQLVENIQWTSELGNAFLAQQSGVMDAVQRMRAKAKGAGKLQSNEQMKVETKVVESKSVVVIEQANPQVVYVPSYDPVVVWGAPPVYAYPPVAYPPGYYAAGAAISFGVGVAMGAMWSGGWGYGAGWGGNNNININNNNNFVRNNNSRTNVGNNVGSGNRGGGNSWQHNPQHRGGAPYGDRSTANKFGGSARGDSAATRQAGARQNQGTRTGSQSGTGNRATGGAGGNVATNRAGGAGGNVAANRDAGRTSSGNRGDAGGSNRIGNRQVSGGSSGNRGAFGGAGGGGSAARSSGSRGASSMGGSRGGGGGRRR
jgi:hypothetical protein